MSIFLKKQTVQRGFTLLEAIIYVGLTGMVLVAVTLFSLEFTLTKSKSTSLARANRYVQFVSTRITHEIRSADGINYGSSVFDTNPGTISLATTAAGTNPTVISVSGNALMIQQGAGDPVALTPTDLEVTNFTVEDVADENDSRSIRFLLGLSYVNPDSLEFSDASASLATTVRSWKDDGFGTSSGTPPGLSFVHTTDEDFNGGTVSQTVVSGVGAAGLVELAIEPVAETWTLLTRVEDKAIFSVDGAATDDVWAGADGANLYRYDGSSWSEVTSPAGDDIRGISAAATNDVHLVSKDKKAYRWNGSSWSTEATLSEELYAVSTVSSSFAVAVGKNGLIAHWNGSSWSEVASPTTKPLYGVSMLSATDGFAVGQDGTVVRWNGTAWSLASFPTADDLWAVDYHSSGLAMTGSDQDNVFRWDGSSWTQETLPTTKKIFAVGIWSATEAWAAGESGTIISWDGSTWTEYASPTGDHLRAITPRGVNGGWVCGEHGRQLRYNYSDDYYSSGNLVSSVLDTASDSSTFNQLSWSENLPANTDMTIATRTGDVNPPDGTWSAWSAEQITNTGVDVSSPDARYIQYRASLSTSDTNYSPQFNDLTITYSQ